MTNPKKEYAKREPLANDEILAMLKKADEIKNEYFRLRVKALIGLLKKFGKRRIEIARLKRSNLEVKEDYLYVTFTLAKKRKDNLTSLHKVSCRDFYAKLIIEYMEHLKQHVPNTVYLFPSGKAVFESYIILPDKHLSGRQLLRLVKQLNPRAWMHLFRERLGGEIAERMGRTIGAVEEVKDVLDLEKEETAWHYVKRFAAHEAPTEIIE